MIAYLKGAVLDKDLESIILNVNGVGYRVVVTNKIIQESVLGSELEIWTYLAVRENSMDLYGFKDKEEREMFGLLLTISGIGPKSAMAILSSATVETLTEGIHSEDAAYLAKISGLGRKSAEKIVIGLKDKLGVTVEKPGDQQNQNILAIDALISLGYSERESREAIKNVEKTDSPEGMIKEALKKLNS